MEHLSTQPLCNIMVTTKRHLVWIHSSKMTESELGCYVMKVFIWIGIGPRHRITMLSLLTVKDKYLNKQ